MRSIAPWRYTIIPQTECAVGIDARGVKEAAGQCTGPKHLSNIFWEDGESDMWEDMTW